MTRRVHGTVRGKTIELDEDLGVADGQHVDKRDSNFVANNPRILGAYDLANLRIGIEKGDYSGSLFVSNLTDERANLSDTTYSGLYQGQPYTWLRRNVNVPRTYGLVVSRRF